MYAVIETGGKQYKVKKGDRIDIERLEGNEGDNLSFDKVLLTGDGELKVGKPYIDGAKVGAKIVDQFRAKKLTVYKKKRRKGYEVRRGHRQNMSKVEITNIQA